MNCFKFILTCILSLYYSSAYSTHHILMSMSIATQWNGEEYCNNALLQQLWADKFFFQHYKFTGDERVLDIGSGDGKLTARIADKVPRGYVIGLDKSDSMVSFSVRAYQEKDNLQFILVDANDKQFYENQPQMFDLVVSFTVLHWVKEQETVLRGIRKVLKPGGKFYLRLSSKGGDPIQDIADGLMKTDTYHDLFKNFVDPMTRFDIDEYQQLLKNADLHVIKIEDVEEQDKIEGKAQLTRQLKSWLPHYHYLEEENIEVANSFMDSIVERYLQDYPPDSHGIITLHDHYLEVVGT